MIASVFRQFRSTRLIFTNKYTEGYPFNRYYGGCENVDLVEEIAINRAKNYSIVIMSTYNLTREHKEIRQFLSF